MQTTFLLKLAAVAAIALAAVVPTVASADYSGQQPTVPSSLSVNDENHLYLVGHAVGTQNYVCRASGGAYAWTFVAPSAVLYDEEGNQITTHGAGPFWQANDGSRVVAAAAANVAVPGTIPWLLLRVTSSTAGLDDDSERLSGTTFIQRLNTTGGMAPAPGCNAGSVGSTANVPYTADYYFYKLRD